MPSIFSIQWMCTSGERSRIFRLCSFWWGIGKKSIFIRQWRRVQRRQLLHRIVLDDAVELDGRDDEDLLRQLEDAFLEPTPRYGTLGARILIRYSFHLGQYFPSDAISPLTDEVFWLSLFNIYLSYLMVYFRIYYFFILCIILLGYFLWGHLLTLLPDLLLTWL